MKFTILYVCGCGYSEVIPQRKVGERVPVEHECRKEVAA